MAKLSFQPVNFQASKNSWVAREYELTRECVEWHCGHASAPVKSAKRRAISERPGVVGGYKWACIGGRGRWRREVGRGDSSAHLIIFLTAEYGYRLRTHW